MYQDIKLILFVIILISIKFIFFLFPSKFLHKSPISAFVMKLIFSKISEFSFWNFSKIFILVDTNTHDNCLPEFLSNISYSSEFEIIEMEAGELHKTLETCTQVWHALSELGADRKSLLINLQN